MSQHAAFGDIGGSAVAAGVSLEGDGFDLHSSSEIIFSPSITLDNGLTFGVNIQFEGENPNAATRVDESYMSISGDSFGTLDIGSENSAGYKLSLGAPGVTSMWINSPSISTFIPLSGVLPFAFRQAAISSYTEVGGNNDVQRISYYTPSFNGLTIGVSYAPTGALNVANSFDVNTNKVLSDIFDIGVNYSQSFGTTDVGLSARYGTGDAPVGTLSDPDTWAVAFNIGFNGFTVGGSYAENDNGGVAGVGDQEGWSFGVTYDAAGPWAFEALTYQGEYTSTGDAGDAGDAGGNEDYEAYRIGASRDLGPGVDWDIYAIYAEGRDNDIADGAGTIDGTIIGTGINLSF